MQKPRTASHTNIQYIFFTIGYKDLGHKKNAFNTNDCICEYNLYYVPLPNESISISILYILYLYSI